MTARGLAVALAAVALALPPARAADPDDAAFRQDAAPRRSREFRDSVNRAIDRGVAALRLLRGKVAAYGVGGDALMLYTLRACGVPAADPLIAKGYADLRRQFDAMPGQHGTYSCAVFLMAMEAHLPGDAGDALARVRALDDADRRRLEAAVKEIVRAQHDSGGFTYGAGSDTPADNSNTQYALLGLKAARRCGIEVPTVAWERAVRHWLDAQEKNGPEVARREPAGVDEDGYSAGGFRTTGKDRARGWGYHARGGQATGSMTVAGISSLAICMDELRGNARFGQRIEEMARTALRDGISWMGLRFRVDGNPVAHPSAREGSIPTPTWHYYYLYGLERAGVLAGTAWFGERDWYGEGAEYLVREQKEDGTWRSAMGFELMAPALDTCFALLFLKRATFRLGPRGTSTDDALGGDLDLSGAADLDDGAFRPVFDAVFLRWRRASASRRASLARDFVRLGRRSLPHLVVLLDDPAESVRADAIDALARVTGDARGYRADAPEVHRARALEAWEEWWFRVREHLVADVEGGRFIETR